VTDSEVKSVFAILYSFNKNLANGKIFLCYLATKGLDLAPFDSLRSLRAGFARQGLLGVHRANSLPPLLINI